MANETTSYVDMLRKFGSDLGLPKVDVDKLIESHKKNIDALSQSATVAAQGAQSVAQKQREIFEAGLQEATKLAQGYQPLGKLQDNLALQTEFAKKVFEIAVKGAQESATTARQYSISSHLILIPCAAALAKSVPGSPSLALCSAVLRWWITSGRITRKSAWRLPTGRVWRLLRRAGLQQKP